MNIVLLAPEIPQNTGSIGRLCVNLNYKLHLIKPLGFSLEEKMLRRAGLDYWEFLDLRIHESWEDFIANEQPNQFAFASTKTTQCIYDLNFKACEYIIFGSESSGLPPDFYEKHKDGLFQIPMPGEHARSLNLANSVAIVAYEAYRQINHS